MSFLGNVIWFVFGGFLSGMMWFAVGLLWCVTIVGIPVGLQCFKLARMSFFPFGKSVVYQGGVVKLVLNVLWLIFGGIGLAASHFVLGLVYCITIVGIPFGIQHFKMAKLALMPLGAKIVNN